jgi:hypothetical protein
LTWNPVLGLPQWNPVPSKTPWPLPTRKYA